MFSAIYGRDDHLREKRALQKFELIWEGCSADKPVAFELTMLGAVWRPPQDRAHAPFSPLLIAQRAG
ncbi:hypothetical protein XI01_04400 [Bradyrhizobium sp. CCBAU 21360]|nr:hypothetical protein [Bradyrhizobium sp. CCBAU 21360]